jgi:hypothetical protein
LHKHIIEDVGVKFTVKLDGALVEYFEIRLEEFFQFIFGREIEGAAGGSFSKFSGAFEGGVLFAETNGKVFGVVVEYSMDVADVI